MIVDNRARLVVTLVGGRVAPPRIHPQLIAHDAAGRSFVLPGTGGVHPTVHAGDPVDGWAADHLVPGISAEDSVAGSADPGSFHLLASLGNRVLDGGGAPLGVVAGKRGGLAPGFWPPSLVGIEAPTERLARVSPGDRLTVEAVGRGLALSSHPEIALFNLSPRLLDALPLEDTRDRLAVDVAAIVPSRAAGAGLGQDAWIGDLEITDAALWKDRRFGDLVAFVGIAASTARRHVPGHVSVGIVSHGPGPAPGHGVGVTIILSGSAAALEANLVAGAGVGDLLRTWGSE